MDRYRIVEWQRQTKVLFEPQYRFLWLFWWPWSHGTYSGSVAFNSYDEALEFIQLRTAPAGTTKRVHRVKPQDLWRSQAGER